MRKSDLDEGEALSIAELEDLLGWRLRQKSCDDEVDQTPLPQNVKNKEIAVADWTAAILHLVHGGLEV